VLEHKKYNPKNERLKREFFDHLRDAQGFSENTVEATKHALLRFEKFTRFADFDTLNTSDATNFKQKLFDIQLSHATIRRTLNGLKRFYEP
jgi:site-specific recombinase XerD